MGAAGAREGGGGLQEGGDERGEYASLYPEGATARRQGWLARASSNSVRFIASRPDPASHGDGREFVGRGIQPHVVVHPTVSDFRAGRDTVLEAALRELRKPAK